MMNPLSSILTVAALVMAPVASAQVTTLLPKHTRSVIYNYTPAETPDSTTVAALDADGEPELNMMFFDGEEMVMDNDSLYMEYDSFNPTPSPRHTSSRQSLTSSTYSSRSASRTTPSSRPA